MGQEKLGKPDPAVIKAVGLYGGGIAASGNVCGALLGAVAALSTVYSRGALEETEHPAMRAMGGRLVRRFEELAAPHGGIRCSDIARVDWKDPAAIQHFRTSPDSRRAYCTQIVGDITESLGELLDEPPAQS